MTDGNVIGSISATYALFFVAQQKTTLLLLYIEVGRKIKI
jgi:hypothetical protein